MPIVLTHIFFGHPYAARIWASIQEYMGFNVNPLLKLADEYRSGKTLMDFLE